MEPVSPVYPESQVVQVTLGENQPEYTPLPAVICGDECGTIATRWRFTEDERNLIYHEGGELILRQLTFGNLFQPVSLVISEKGKDPE